MSGDTTFSPRLIAVWIGVAVAAFVAALYFMAKGDNGRAVDPVGPTTASRSALGYAGIADILERIGAPVIRSRSRSVERAGTDGVLVIAEPRFSPQSLAGAQKLLKAPAVLLILPKWDGRASLTHQGWIDNAQLAPWIDAELALSLADSQASVARGPPAARWTRNAIGLTPAIDAPMQFIRSKTLKPIVAAGDSILVGEVSRQGRRLWVLADPDVIANHGLARPANADFAVALVGALRTSDGPVVFDEAIHAVAGSTPSLVRLLFRFPYNIATFETLVAIGLLLWATTIRFGAPEPSLPPLGPGKLGLIDGAAALMVLAGRRALIVRRFAEETVRDVARRLGAPRGLTGPALADWLARVGAARGIAIDPAAELARAHALADGGSRNDSQLVGIARNIALWKQGMTDGH